MVIGQIDFVTLTKTYSDKMFPFSERHLAHLSKIAITQTIFELGPTDFAWQYIRKLWNVGNFRNVETNRHLMSYIFEPQAQADSNDDWNFRNSGKSGMSGMQRMQRISGMSEETD